MNQSPGLQVVAVLLWLNAIFMIWYMIEHPERSIAGYFIASLVTAFLFTILIYVPSKGAPK